MNGTLRNIDIITSFRHHVSNQKMLMIIKFVVFLFILKTKHAIPPCSEEIVPLLFKM